jgi:uncharacterized membrane protein
MEDVGVNPWLEVFGRFHPLLLHVPIGLLVALGALELITLRQPAGRVRTALAALTALAAVVTASSGWVLGHSPDRTATETLSLHQTLGLCLAGTCVLLALLARVAERRPAPYRVLLLFALVLMAPTGHLGATMTQGEDFLFEPLHRAQAAPASAAGPTAQAATQETAPSAAAYADVIAPILAARCSACHNEARHKGGLVVITPAGLRAGGRDGPVLVPGQGQPSELLRRVQLPLEHEDHMPPDNKPQPTAEEIAALQAWIAAGAPFEGPVPGLHAPAPAAAPPAALPTSPAASPPADKPAGMVPPASPGALAALRDALVHVEPAEPGDNLLWVDGAAVAATLTDARASALLEPVCEQLGELSLARAPVGDALAPLLARCPHLRRLDLSRTAFTSAGLAQLAGHARLEELVLVRCQLADEAVDSLLALPALRRVHLWGAGLSEAALTRLRAARPSLDVDAGEPRAAEALETEPPVAVGAPSQGPPVNTTCPVSGKPVDAAFTLLHEGRVIGFCCSKCPMTFAADPAKYAAAIK